MSMSSWTTNAYGVTNEDITTIPMSSVWPIFMAIQTAAVLADLVARNLHIAFGNVIVEKNEDDDIIVGIGAYYPWEMPEALKHASQEDYENAFINAYAMFGIDGRSCCIEEQSIENWG